MRDHPLTSMTDSNLVRLRRAPRLEPGLIADQRKLSRRLQQ
jgi:hypothetical protein